MDYYKTIDKESIEEFKDRGSRFIGVAFPANDASIFKEKLMVQKKLHLKAVHHCFAYRFGLDGNNFRTNDDGEPKGTAGKPILVQIDSLGLTNVVVIVVRYFGGTLLGVPGLINAYKTTAALALQTAHIIAVAVEINYRIECPYTLINEVMHILKQNNCTIISINQQMFCTIETGISKIRLAAVLDTLYSLHGVNVQPMT